MLGDRDFSLGVNLKLRQLGVKPIEQLYDWDYDL